MPTYDFKCEDGHHFSDFFKVIWKDDMQTPPCPECGGVTVRLITAPNISGFIFERMYQAEKDQVDRELRGEI